MKSVTLILIVFIVVIFVVQAAIPGLTDNFALVSSQVMERPWILVTSTFLHGSPSHLLGNMFALFLFGIILENIIGSKKFLILYFASGIAASIAAAYFYDTSLGASGAIFGILGALTVLRPKMTVWTYGVPMPMIVAAVFWLVLDVMGVFYPTNVANFAHIAGLTFGVVAGFWLRRKEPKQPKERKEKILNDEELDRWEDVWMK